MKNISAKNNLKKKINKSIDHLLLITWSGEKVMAGQGKDKTISVDDPTMDAVVDDNKQANSLHLSDLHFGADTESDPAIDGKTTGLAEIDKWTEDGIKARNDSIVAVLLKLFAFYEDEIAELDQEEST